MQVFQSAVNEAKRFKDSGGDTMGEIIDILGKSVTNYKQSVLFSLYLLMLF